MAGASAIQFHLRAFVQATEKTYPASATMNHTRAFIGGRGCLETTV
jgi:hypothetical protein